MNKILDKVVEHILVIPQLLFTTFMSFLSGHIWLWILYSFFLKSNKGLTHLKSIWAKTGLGVLWYSIFLVPCYIKNYGWNMNVDEKILNLIVFTVIIGTFAQSICLILIIFLKKQR